MNEEERVSIAVPHVSFESVRKVVGALFAYKKPGSAIEIKGIAGLNMTNTSKALSIAQGLGLAKAVSRGVYGLTREGRELSRQLGFKKEEAAKKLLKQAILKSKEWDEIVTFLRANVGKTRETMDLVMHVESRLDKQWKSSVRLLLARNYRSYLSFANLIDSEGNKIVSKLSLDEDSEISTTVGQPPERKDGPEDKHPLQPDSEYATYSLPDLFTLHVKPTRQALDYLKKQLKEDSSLAGWVDAVISSLEGDHNS